MTIADGQFAVTVGTDAAQQIFRLSKTTVILQDSHSANAVDRSNAGDTRTGSRGAGDSPPIGGRATLGGVDY